MLDVLEIELADLEEAGGGSGSDLRLWYDRSVLLAMVCGADDVTAASRLDVRTSSDPTPEPQTAVVVGDGAASSLLLVLTPPAVDAQWLRMSSPGGPEVEEILADAPPSDCPGSTDPAFETVACGAWTVLELAEPLPPDAPRSARDVEVRDSDGRVVDALTWTLDSGGARRLFLSAPFDTGRGYDVRVSRSLTVGFRLTSA